MKKIIIILCLLIFGIRSSNAQSKDETIRWLNDKFNNSYLVDGEGGLWRSAREFKYLSLGYLTMTCYDYKKDILFPSDKNYTSVKYYSVFLSNLSPNSVRVVKSGDFLLFLADCTKGDCIEVLGGTLIGVKTKTIVLGVTRNEQNLEERVKKALIHLITLCGGKNETF
jgi:hypothetical protein